MLIREIVDKLKAGETLEFKIPACREELRVLMWKLEEVKKKVDFQQSQEGDRIKICLGT